MLDSKHEYALSHMFKQIIDLFNLLSSKLAWGGADYFFCGLLKCSINSIHFLPVLESQSQLIIIVNLYFV